MASAFTALFSVSGGIFSFVAVIYKCVKTFIHFKDQISALATVSAVRTTVGNIKLSSEAAMPISALTGADEYLSSVCKHIFLL